MSISIPKARITLDLVHPQECILQKFAVVVAGTLQELLVGKKPLSSHPGSLLLRAAVRMLLGLLLLSEDAASA